jgi:peptidoglycan/LPS O-acetylase OafA/YrhL
MLPVDRRKAFPRSAARANSVRTVICKPRELDDWLRVLLGNPVSVTPASTAVPSVIGREGLPRVLGLDGVRGLAVLLVLLDHAGDSEMRIFPGADLNRIGKYGVYLFFVLSAFLLTRQFSQWPRADFVKARSWIDYALRRFLRIFPVYAVVLVALFFMHKVQLADLGSHLLLRDGKGQFWTVPVEVKYYALLPFIALTLFWAARKHWALGVAAGIGASAVAWGIFALEQKWSLQDVVYLSRNLAPFLIGSLTALLSGLLLRHPGTRQRLGWWLEIGAGAAVVALLLRMPSLHHLIFSEHSFVGKEFDPIICGVVWSLFLLGILHGRGFSARFMEWKPLRYLGLISFSAYLWHRKFVSDIDDLPVPSAIRLLVFLAIVVTVSTASYLLLERPLARWRWRAREA